MNPSLADLLNLYLQRSLYSQGQLAALSGVPKNTLTNWLAGRVTKPHHWHGLIRVASALRLTAPEADALLRAAGHPSLVELRLANPKDQSLFTPWTNAKPIPFQALPDIPYFVGREAEIDEIKKILYHGGYFCCLRGMGGVGKTALATRLAYELRPAFPDGVLWARLDTSDSMTILYTLAGTYGLDVSTYTTLDSRAALVRGLLAHKRALLILDNAESSTQLAPLLPPTTGSCAILVTTRFELAITDGWPQLELHPFTPESSHALTLFSHFFGAARVQKNRGALQEIATRVGHLPLALAILAAQLGHPTQEQIQAMLERFQVSYDRLSELEREQRSVRATFETSYTALLPEAQWFFAQLGVFGGEDFTGHVAATVTETPLEETQHRLRQLRQLSLLQDSRDKRFRLHPLLRDFARQKILAQPDSSTPYARMIHYYLQQATFPGAYTAPPIPLLQELSNLMACLDLAYEHHLFNDLLDAIRAFFEVLYQQGLANVLEKPLNRAIVWAQIHEEKSQQAEMLTLLGRVQYWQGRDPRDTYQTALQLAREGGHEYLICESLRLLSAQAWRENQFPQAYALAQEGLEMARRLGNSVKVSELLVNLGATAYVQKEFLLAETNYREAQEIAEKIPYPRLQMLALQNLACLYADRGAYAQAVPYFQQGADLGRQLGFREALVGLLGDWAYRALRAHDLSIAETMCHESLELARRMGHTARTATRLSDLGEIARLQGDLSAAWKCQQEALALVKESSLLPVRPLVYLRFAKLYFDEGKYELAHAALQQCFVDRAFLHDEFEPELRETQTRFETLK